MAPHSRSVPYDAALACRTLAAKDSKLARLMERAGPLTLRLKPTASPFEALLEAIVHQQLNGRAAQTIHSRVLALFGAGHHPTAEVLLQLPDASLRAAGLSGSKLAALRDLAQKTLDGVVPSLARLRQLDDAEIVEHLTQVRGIGVWTVEMLLLFRLGRPDVLPVSDYGVRKGYALTFLGLEPGTRVQPADLPPAEVIRKRAVRWQPWCSVASWYLWRACDLAAQTASAPEPVAPARKAPARPRTPRRKS
jgi:DNA-3-methyladenine glycosylase II